MDAIPTESNSVSLMLHCMLEQVVLNCSAQPEAADLTPVEGDKEIAIKAFLSNAFSSFEADIAPNILHQSNDQSAQQTGTCAF